MRCFCPAAATCSSPTPPCLKQLYTSLPTPPCTSIRKRCNTATRTRSHARIALTKLTIRSLWIGTRSWSLCSRRYVLRSRARPSQSRTKLMECRRYPQRTPPKLPPSPPKRAWWPSQHRRHLLPARTRRARSRVTAGERATPSCGSVDASLDGRGPGARSRTNESATKVLTKKAPPCATEAATTPADCATATGRTRAGPCLSSANPC
mmetsp:Transcript_9240/g.17294  ORF Transcript_9240/g.17294 Transcript_9240/m.17294 type:complete len:207 (-) Transcript_9240:1703-2323(-)